MMMSLYMKQKVFSWGDKFAVWDADQNVRYTVQGEVFSWGKKLHVFGADGAELAYIQQRLWSWLPKYEVEIGGRLAFVVRKEFSFLRPRYRVEGADWRIEGEFWAHEYEVLGPGDELIMGLSKHWFTWGDSYELRIPDPQNEVACLCLALAVDAAIEATASASSSSST